MSESKNQTDPNWIRLAGSETKRLQLWLPPDLIRRVKIACAASDQSVTGVIHALLEDWLADRKSVQL